MKTKWYLVLLILPLIFVVTGCQKKDNAMGPQNQSATEEEEELFRTTPEKMIALGKSFHCTFSYEVEKGVTSSGEFYVDGKNRKFRTESVVKGTETSKDIRSMMIFDNDMMYAWSDNQTYPAMKMKVDTSVGADAEADQSGLYDTAEYRCKKWTVDEAMFTPPANIQFIDYQKMMGSLGQ